MLITPKKAAKVAALAILTALIFTLISFLYLRYSGQSDSECHGVRFVFFDVGQGDAALIETDAGVCLIDAGPESGQDTLCTVLCARGISEISFMFITHTDSDHSGGADAILRNFNVKALYLPAAVSECTALTEIHRAAATSDTDIRLCAEGDLFLLGNTEIRVLSPSFPFAGDENSDSTVLLVSYGKTRALFMADADTTTEERLIGAYSTTSALSVNTDSPFEDGASVDYNPTGLFCDILKVGHHGSETSSSFEFLSAVRPVYAVISCGRANSYGHPSPLILHRLKNIGAQILRTDLSGNIILESDGINIKYRQ